MKTKLSELIERAAFEAGQGKCASMDRADAAAARADDWQDEAIEACVDFGIAGPDDRFADLFITAFTSGAERRAIDDEIGDVGYPVESLGDEHMRRVHGDGSGCEDGCDRPVQS